MPNRSLSRWLALLGLALPVWLMVQFWHPAVRAASLPASKKKHAYSGAAQACATCHAAESTEQPFTPMGSTLELPDSNPVALKHSLLTTRRGVYTYTVETKAGATTYSVTDGQRTIALPVLWSVGANAQTWLVEYEGRLYESMVSYYPSIDGLDVTTADDVLKLSTLEAAIGRAETEAQTKSCFSCHATRAVTDDELTLSTLQRGVTCEHCHTGISEHLTAIRQGKSAGSSQTFTPPSLGKLNAEQISSFCGQCHRTWEDVVRGGTRGTPNVRFQVYRLTNSRCFDGTDSRISCVACHDPHRELTSNQTDPAFYDEKCQACHAPAARNIVSPQREMPKQCPVANTGCVTCHMPKTKVLNGPSEFTDHEIRVVRGGEPYPN